MWTKFKQHYGDTIDQRCHPSTVPISKFSFDTVPLKANANLV